MWLRILALTTACLAASPAARPEGADQPGLQRPNFVVIVIDDAALMDLGVYGGEAATPNIDSLAARGMVFTRYISSPLCSPSRAMLLTGVNNHRTGVATIPEVLPPEHVGKPGYGMALEPGVLTIARRLKPHGYRTLMTGKWHLGSGPGNGPESHGFDRSFALDASGADNWEDKSYIPFYPDAPWFEDGKHATLPDDFYSSRFIVEKMIEYLEEGGNEAPFLAYLAFQAIHIPVQAPPEFTARYRQTYTDGWEALRERRWEKAREQGLVPASAAPPEIHPALRRWEDLTRTEQERYAARMAVNAGMLEAMDHYLGDLIAYLKETGAFADTVFVITSDNGPEPSSADDLRLRAWMLTNGYHIGTRRIGEKGSYGFIGPEFASAAAIPGALFKFYVSEGGVRVPLIISGPGIMAGRTDAFSIVTDITPTLLEMARAGPAPESSIQIDGRSLIPVLSGEAQAVYSQDDAIGLEVSGNAALYKGQWKIVRNLEPWGDGQWRLFDILADPGETRDLASDFPEIMAQMQADYAAYAARNGVLEVPEGYNSVRQVDRNVTGVALRRELPRLLFLIIPAGIITALILFLRSRTGGTRKRRESH